MAGCYGNHPEDRYFERMLNKHLDETYPDEEEDIDIDEDDDDELTAEEWEEIDKEYERITR